MYLESTLYIKISKLINRNRRKNQLSIFYVQLAVKNALSIINFNSSPVNIKKTWCTVIDFVRIWNQFLFSINHTFYRLQSGWNKCKCLANKKAQPLTDTISHRKKNFENTETTILQYVFLVLLLRGVELIKMQ